VRRLPVDEYLLHELELRSVLEQPHWQYVVVHGNEPIVQMGTADTAEGALCPVRGLEPRDLVGTFDPDVRPAVHAHHRAATPAPAHAAVAGVHLRIVAGRDAYRATEASA